MHSKVTGPFEGQNKVTELNNEALEETFDQLPINTALYKSNIFLLKMLLDFQGICLSCAIH